MGTSCLRLAWVELAVSGVVATAYLEFRPRTPPAVAARKIAQLTCHDLTVLLSVYFRGVLVMLNCMQVMTVRYLGMMRGLFVFAGLMLFSGSMMVFSGLFVMMRCFLAMPLVPLTTRQVQRTPISDRATLLELMPAASLVTSIGLLALLQMFAI
jgi:hypothetical protein